jgi:two-component system, OmpR family, sensor kinase
MVSLGSSIRSAARATFSAYRSVPIRWRLAGGSAGLTLVILAGFAVVVGHFTAGQVRAGFYEQVSNSLAQLNVVTGKRLSCAPGQLNYFASADSAEIRVLTDDGTVVCTQGLDAKGGVLSNRAMQLETPVFYPPDRAGASTQDGYQLEARQIQWMHGKTTISGWLIYARELSTIDREIARVQLILVLGVVGGTVLALLAGLATAQRAIRPIAELTDAAREIERTGDPSLRIPHIAANDEVAELALTLDGMLAALDSARADTEGALRRQREFVADASHELRTPLTAVLANLELLADELSGEQADSAKSALRSTRRMRRLVGDLLLLARADADRRQPDRPTDLGAVLTDAAAELGLVAEGHELSIDPQSVIVEGNADDLHRLILNLVENAIRHTPPGTSIRGRVGLAGDAPQLVVEDDGPGIPAELQRRVFERFVRGGGDTAGRTRGTGLGLAIVRAVADSHGATVELGTLDDGTGTRFVITFRAEPTRLADQTSTTTGSTIGRRRSRS